VTGLVERMVAEGVVSRRRAANDRRAHIVRLTEKGRRQFRKMAKNHEQWIADLFAGLSRNDVRQLLVLLGKTKSSARIAVRTER
jgi:DNA-binding MarR family transcriptional regulator